jgi:hypothetical protein
MARGRGRRTLELIEACHEILAAIQPAGVRAVAYQLFTRGLIESMAKKETNRVSRILTDAREDRLVPWEWVVDEAREVERGAGWADPSQFVRQMRTLYRRDHWALQPRVAELWAEKGTVGGTLRPVLEEFGVPFRVMHGYGSSTAVYDAVREALVGGKDVAVLYVGDCDPCGMHMTAADLPARLESYRRALLDDWDLAEEARDRAPVIHLERLALTQADVEAGDLPSFPVETKMGDTRWRWFRYRYGRRCWELDALDPRILREQMRAAITDIIDAPLWQRSVAAEEAEAASLRTVFDRWNGSQ